MAKDIEIRDNSIQLYDLGLVTALSLSYPYQAYKNNSSNKVYFKFPDLPEVQVNINEYWNDQLQVSAKAFAEQLKSIKSRIYQEFRNVE